MLKKLFGFDKETMTIKKEVVAGMTSFLTMAYILAVNPSILSAAGMDHGALFTATAISAAIGTLVMAVYAKLPFALAPGMGLNAFFAFTICGLMGYTWQFALTAVLIEGILFTILTLANLRQKIVDWLPDVLKNAISPSIGLFIAFIGLQNAGIIVKNDATFVALGNLQDIKVILSFVGIFISTVLLVYNVKGALLLGIFAVTIIGIPFGIINFSGAISLPPSIEPIFCKFDFSGFLTIEKAADLAVCVFTLLFMDIFDTMGTLIGVTNYSGMNRDKKNPMKLKHAFMADSVGTTVGAILGTSTVTVFVESAAGVNVGGRSGLTAATTAVCFLLALLFAPLFLAIPPQATAPALVLVGMMMMRDVIKIPFNNYLYAVPCAVCLLFMPLAYSISDAISLSVISWVVLHVLVGKVKELNIGLIILAVLFILKYAFL